MPYTANLEKLALPQVDIINACKDVCYKNWGYFYGINILMPALSPTMEKTLAKWLVEDDES